MKAQHTFILLTVLTLLVCLAFAPCQALADDAGVLSENELNTWIAQVLRESMEEQPSNAPIGEDALTEEGYAYLYSFATLYYNKPVLDAESILQGLVLTDEAFPSPRGICVGSDMQMLLDSYGWQNPMLLGDGSFAALYRLDQLPQSAYWAWGQLENGELVSVQCAIHVRIGENRYTDAGIVYDVEKGKVADIRVYGLNSAITEMDVQSNLRAIMATEAAITGDEHEAPAVEGYQVSNEQKPFAANDLLFGTINYLTFTEENAVRQFGQALSQEEVADDNGSRLLTTRREGLSLSYTISESGAASLESLSVNGDLTGPRGIRVGMGLEEVLALFYSDGQGRTTQSAALLYGDGQTTPTATLERNAQGEAELRYQTAAATSEGERNATLHMTFVQEQMTEWMIYSW